MNFVKSLLCIAVFSVFVFYACKGKSDPQPEDKCASKAIELTATVTDASKCESNGKIVVKGTGKGVTGFTYQLNSGAFKSDSVFSNLSQGTYTITIKEAGGCAKSAKFTVNEQGTKGPLFTAALAVIATRCNGVNCHATGSGGAPIGILSTDCDVISRRDLINTKVLGPENMGTLSTSEKQKISAWITAGGHYNN